MAAAVSLLAQALLSSPTGTGPQPTLDSALWRYGTRRSRPTRRSSTASHRLLTPSWPSPLESACVWLFLQVFDGVASFLCQLPHDLPPAQKTLCFGEAARLLPPEQRPLLPHIALRAVTHRQSLPLPPPAQPAALAGAPHAHHAWWRGVNGASCTPPPPAVNRRLARHAAVRPLADRSVGRRTTRGRGRGRRRGGGVEAGAGG